MKEGTIVGARYVLREVIGDGAAAVVWRAHDQRLGADVAVKVLRTDHLANADIVARFRAEAAVLVKLQHPNIVRVTDLGEHDGLPYLVMEYVRGETAADLVATLAATPQTWPETTLREIFFGVLDAVAELHAHGIVHRDIKLDNVVLLSLADGRRVAKLVDFGIARADAGSGTAHGLVYGTWNYMPPEQASGLADKVAPASDVFALAVSFIELVTGVASAGAAKNLTWAMCASNDALGPSLDNARRTAHVELPDAAWDVVRLALDADLSKRYPTAGFLRKELARAWPAAQASAVPRGDAPLRPEAPVVAPRSPGATWTLAGGALLVAGTIGALRLLTADVENHPANPNDARVVVRHDAPAPAESPLAAVGSAPTIPTTRLPALPADRRCPDGMRFIPAGRFRLGSEHPSAPADERGAELDIAAFCLDETEVTVGAWRRARSQLPNLRIASASPLCNTNRSGVDLHAVNCVSWTQARAFCGLSTHAGGARRLPTESEWEYAARAGRPAAYPWGNEAPSDQLCWRQQAPACMTRVFAPNGFGLFDMAGGVREWTDSVFRPYGSPGGGSAELPVARGGSFNEQLAADVTVTRRFPHSASDDGITLGFRCARAPL